MYRILGLLFLIHFIFACQDIEKTSETSSREKEEGLTNLLFRNIFLHDSTKFENQSFFDNNGMQTNLDSFLGSQPRILILNFSSSDCQLCLKAEVNVIRKLSTESKKRVIIHFQNYTFNQYKILVEKYNLNDINTFFSSNSFNKQIKNQIFYFVYTKEHYMKYFFIPDKYLSEVSTLYFSYNNIKN